MQIEFKQHQLVVAGLTAQINILNRRCVEHQQRLEQVREELQSALDSYKIALTAERENRNLDVNGYEQRCEVLETKIADLECKLKEDRKQRRKSSKVSDAPKAN